MKRLVPAFLLLGAATMACTSAPSGNSPKTDALLKECVPNQTLVCLCNGLDEGTQTCTADGTMTECDCAHKTRPDAGPQQPPPPKPVSPTPTTMCGDGHVDPGEACDDGNSVDGDGCSSTCQPDGSPTTADTCPGQSVTLWKGSTIKLTGTTSGYWDNFSTSCSGSTGPDRVYMIRPSVDGFMSIDAVFAPGFNAIVEVRRGACNVETASMLCENTATQPFKRVVRVQKDTTYYLIVDGDLAEDEGVYTIDLELS